MGVVNCNEGLPAKLSKSTVSVFKGDLTDIEGLWVADPSSEPSGYSGGSVFGSFGIYYRYDTFTADTILEFVLEKIGPMSLKMTSPLGEFPEYIIDLKSNFWSGLSPDANQNGVTLYDLSTLNTSPVTGNVATFGIMTNYKTPYSLLQYRASTGGSSSAVLQLTGFKKS